MDVDWDYWTNSSHLSELDTEDRQQNHKESVNVLKIESIKAASSRDLASQSGTREAKLDIIFLAYNNYCENTTITTPYRVTSTEPVS